MKWSEFSAIDEESNLPSVLERGNFWTSKQRQSNSLHEISYRACFKAELPDYFITRYTSVGETVYDPFMGRGTTPIQAAIRGRVPVGMDINPISAIFTAPRLDVPELSEIEDRLDQLNLECTGGTSEDLTMFYHPATLDEILGLREYLRRRKVSGEEDNLDSFIRMIATNRLTGHSKGFFSVYTLPPNQAASPASQTKINKRLGQKPEYRNVKDTIKRKSRSLLRNVSEDLRARINSMGKKSKILTSDSRDSSKYMDERTVDLTVTSPPFLDTVQYTADNWLRAWFNGITEEAQELSPFIINDLGKWCSFMSDIFADLYRVTKRGGRVGFEVGEIRKGSVKLDAHISNIGKKSGFILESVLINEQKFTKTAHIWGVTNNTYGTNTNRIALFKKL